MAWPLWLELEVRQVMVAAVPVAAVPVAA